MAELSWPASLTSPPKPDVVYLFPEKLKQLAAEYPQYIQVLAGDITLKGFQIYIVEQWYLFDFTLLMIIENQDRVM